MQGTEDLEHAEPNDVLAYWLDWGDNVLVELDQAVVSVEIDQAV